MNTPWEPVDVAITIIGIVTYLTVAVLLVIDRLTSPRGR